MFIASRAFNFILYRLPDFNSDRALIFIASRALNYISYRVSHSIPDRVAHSILRLTDESIASCS
jgi:hypothetical protein